MNKTFSLSESSGLTVEALKELLSYDPETGFFTWKVSRQGNNGIGAKAGYKHRSGYVRIRLNRCGYLAHRLAWFYVHGAWPANQIDHRNRVRDDNRISNLREATASENKQNNPIHGRNTSGYKGVSWDKWGKYWMARICLNGQRRLVGKFKTAGEAAEAYKSASEVLHPYRPEANQ